MNKNLKGGNNAGIIGTFFLLVIIAIIIGFVFLDKHLSKDKFENFESSSVPSFIPVIIGIVVVVILVIVISSGIFRK